MSLIDSCLMNQKTSQSLSNRSSVCASLRLQTIATNKAWRLRLSRLLASNNTPILLIKLRSMLQQDFNLTKSSKLVVLKKKLQSSLPFWSKAQSWSMPLLIWLKGSEYSQKNSSQSMKPPILWCWGSWTRLHTSCWLPQTLSRCAELTTEVSATLCF